MACSGFSLCCSALVPAPCGVHDFSRGIMHKLIKRFLSEDHGVTAIEYAIIAGLMAVAVATAIGDVTGKIATVFTAVVGAM